MASPTEPCMVLICLETNNLEYALKKTTTIFTAVCFENHFTKVCGKLLGEMAWGIQPESQDLNTQACSSYFPGHPTTIHTVCWFKAKVQKNFQMDLIQINTKEYSVRGFSSDDNRAIDATFQIGYKWLKMAVISSVGHKFQKKFPSELGKANSPFFYNRKEQVGVYVARKQSLDCDRGRRRIGHTAMTWGEVTINCRVSLSLCGIWNGEVNLQFCRTSSLLPSVLFL